MPKSVKFYDNDQNRIQLDFYKKENRKEEFLDIEAFDGDIVLLTFRGSEVDQFFNEIEELIAFWKDSKLPPKTDKKLILEL